ncbi:uncharacterized protein LOC116417363 [Nasonia vitripennis]|uniref:Uncharacterized protein n=1 Tax=Nasonia vitripennis TaxID=7425 RepID=A0A7M7QDJ2_NASVI|nr:uncharacterized protein LOC116417363 [Nasonia vitripennis]
MCSVNWAKDESDISHVQVRFTADRTIHVVPINHIIEFKKNHPKHINEFDKDVLYNCLWVDDKNPDGVVLFVQIAKIAALQNEEEYQKLLVSRERGLRPITNSLLDEYSMLNKSDTEEGIESEEDYLPEDNDDNDAVKVAKKIQNSKAAKKISRELKKYILYCGVKSKI